MKIIDFFYEISDLYFDKLIEKRMYYDKNKKDYRLTFLGWFFFIGYKILLYVNEIVWFFTARIICIFKGCDIVQTIIDDNILYEEECKRCGNIVNYSVNDEDTLIRK